MKNNLTRSDIYDVNSRTGALILGKNRLDEYASKYLSHVYKKALLNPMALPVDEILAEMHLTVKYETLSKNMDVFGCCLLLDGDVQVYDKVTDSVKVKSYPAGTILIDPYYVERYGEGARRNTLIHEALHWEKDKRYFEIQQLKNKNESETLYPIMCRQSETFYMPPEGKKTKDNEVRWLEWQAHRLAPRVLMPKEMFKKKALEIIEYPENLDILSPLSCDILIEVLSEFFLVSRSSAKYRLIEVGLESIISQFSDYTDVYAEIYEGQEYQKLTPVDAFTLMFNDSVLQEWINSGYFIYADGYFVLASKKYVYFENDEPHLTDKAKNNLSKCVLNIRAQRCVKYTYFCKEFRGLFCLYNTNTALSDVDKRIYLFDPKFQGNFESLKPEDSYKAAYNSMPTYDEEEEMQLRGMLARDDVSLCQCLCFLMKNRHWSSPSIFSENTLLHPNYYTKIKRDEYNNMGIDVLMALYIGLHLRPLLIEKVFAKATHKLDCYHNPGKTYINILENFPGIHILNFNSMLNIANLPALGTQDRAS